MNVPTPELADEAWYFGTVSGRGLNKFGGKGLTATPGKKVKAPIVEECAVHHECRVAHKNDVIPDELADEIRNSYYRQGDFYRLYFGEILLAYADADTKKTLA